MRTAEGQLLNDDVSNYNSDSYEKPSVTVDIVICTIVRDDLRVLLIKRKYPPFRDHWALPGGFVNIEHKQTLEETAARELQEETGLENIYFEQLKTYGDPDRDPRMRIITVAYFALVPHSELIKQRIQAKDDAKDYKWLSFSKLPTEILAFDHKQILQDTLDRLRGKISYAPLAFNFLQKKFTWMQLQKVYEVILGKKLVTPNFRRKMRSTYMITAHRSKQKKSSGRPPKLFSFNGIKSI